MEKISKSINRILAVVIRHMFAWPRDLDNLSESFWWSTVDLVMWGLLTVYLQSKQDASGVATAFIIGAVILWMFTYRAQQEMGITFLKDFWDRNLMNLLVSPLSIGEFMLATLITGLIKIIITAIYMGIISYLLFVFNIFSFGWYLVPLIINLLLFGWAAGFFVNGLILRYGYRIQSFAWTLIYIVMPFSAVFYPVEVLPGWMQTISPYVPASYMFEGMRSIILNGNVDNMIFIKSLLINVIYLMLSFGFLKRSFENARRSGIILKFS